MGVATRCHSKAFTVKSAVMSTIRPSIMSPKGVFLGLIYKFMSFIEGIAY